MPLTPGGILGPSLSHSFGLSRCTSVLPVSYLIMSRGLTAQAGGPPKRPLNGFMRYLMQEKPTVVIHHPGIWGHGPVVHWFKKPDPTTNAFICIPLCIIIIIIPTGTIFFTMGLVHWHGTRLLTAWRFWKAVADSIWHLKLRRHAGLLYIAFLSLVCRLVFSFKSNIRI